MQQITTKPNTIKTINPLYIQQKQINRLRHQNKLQQFLINCLIILNIVTTVYLVVDNMQQNRIESYPPLEVLEVIGE